MLDQRTNVPLNFSVIAGRDAPTGRVVDRQRLFALMPLLDEEVERIVNRVIGETISRMNTQNSEYPFTSEEALTAWLKIQSILNLRNEFRVSAALDPTGNPL
jgi:hypothetical protein